MPEGKPIGNLVVNVGLNAQGFNKGIDGLNRQMKLSQSAMKANVSQFKAYGDKLGAAESQVSSLSDQLKIQKKIVEEHQKAYEKAKLEYKEGSEQLGKYERKLNNSISTYNTIDGKLRKTKDEVKQFSHENEIAGKTMDETADKTKKGFGSIKTAAIGIGAVIAGAFAVDKIKDFAVGAVEAASNAQALKSQFKQVFGGLSKDAQTSVDGLGESFGMVPNRIKPSFTQMTSMFKGLGLDTEKAMGAAKRSVTLTADAAAFYDMSFEDANSALNSFIKGNYEGGEAIGLFANETQMAKFASGELGKDWKTLDEKGKQLVRLKFAESMQKAAGATGQAKRESDSYQNQLGNLKQVWTDLAAKLGGPLLKPAIKILKGLAKMVENIDPTAVFKSFKSYGETIRTTFAPVFDVIKKVGTGIKGVFSLFKGDKGGGASILSSLGLSPGTVRDVMATVDAIKAGVKGYIGFLGKYVKFQVEVIKKVFGFLAPYVKQALNAILPFVKDIMSKISKFWKGNGDQIVQALKNIGSFLSKVFKVLLPVILEIVKSVWGNIKGVISGAIDVIMGVIKVFSGLFTGDFSKMWEGIKQVFKGAIKFVWNFVQLAFVGKILSLGKGLVVKFIELMGGLWKNIPKLFSKGTGFIQKLVSGAVKKLLSVWKSMRDKSLDTVKNLWTGAQKLFSGGVSKVWGFIKNMGRYIKEGFGNAKDSAIKLLGTMWTKVKTTFGNIVDGAKALPGKIGTGIKNMAHKAYDGLKSLNNKLTGKVAAGINGITGGVNKVLDKLNVPEKYRIPKWNPPKYARGTASHPGGLAIVGDGGGEELIRTPDGKVSLSPNTDTLVNLPKGSSVLPHNQTKQLMSMYGLPAYKNGVGDFFKDIWSYVSSPRKLLNKALDVLGFKLPSMEGTMGKFISGSASLIKNNSIDYIKGKIKNFFSSGGSEPAGKGVERWRGTVAQALAMNGLPTSSAYVEAWLRQIKSESGGNAGVTQSSGVKDINYYTGQMARGLVQVIPATFRAYSFPGHKNPFNGLDSLLAGMNYAKSRYGAKGMLGVIGHGHGYENGGLVNKHQIAQIAEGNKPEMIIPLSTGKRGRALQLLGHVADMFGVRSSSGQGNADSSAAIALLKQQNALQVKTIELLTAILLKDSDVYLDGNTLAGHIGQKQVLSSQVNGFMKGMKGGR
ncbi:hypothetical protein QUF79_14645 [Fictibacillus enclensis]|uniref:hypothetical protein n=1 Tax=Fictibacillus enclensis TaxID=1017270 RepID=UPI0025A0A6C7|nr:hypothetical protein [Fictibacillus enclensis]MDM5199257.1 hypothetical protein [Fictibacillus enclensis]